MFVDRDGVICWNRSDHVKSWEEFEFLPGALEALVCLSEADLAIVVVTNQAIVNRGIVPEGVVRDIHDRMVERVQLAGGRIDQVIYCPHRPDENCGCRKPAQGMISAAAERLGLDVAGSYLIGDACTDILAGQAAGCARCYLVLTGRGLEQLSRCYALVGGGFTVVRNLGMAVKDILSREELVQHQPADLLHAEAASVLQG